MEVSNTSLRRGFNTKTIKNDSTQQKIINFAENNQHQGNWNSFHIWSIFPTVNSMKNPQEVRAADYCSGPNQQRTVDFIKDLCNNKFKKAMVQFFLFDWGILYINIVKCHKFFSNRYGNVQKDEAPQFSCPAHGEAYTTIMYQMCQLQEDSYSHKLLRHRYTDHYVK